VGGYFGGDPTFRCLWHSPIGLPALSSRFFIGDFLNDYTSDGKSKNILFCLRITPQPTYNPAQIQNTKQASQLNPLEEDECRELCHHLTNKNGKLLNCISNRQHTKYKPAFCEDLIRLQSHVLKQNHKWCIET
jgi:hypothetical protein